MRAAKSDRRVIRCPGCWLVQYWPEGKDKCVRCPWAAVWRLTAQLTLKPETPLPPRVDLFDSDRLARKIRQIRQARHLSQRQLAKRQSVPRTYISKLENGRTSPTIDSVLRMAEALDIPPTCFFDDTFLAGHLKQTRADLASREAFMREVTGLVTQIRPHDRELIRHAAQSLAKGQYTLPEWIEV
jgi:transcriptional regulator with XRE-family HTH domain